MVSPIDYQQDKTGFAEHRPQPSANKNTETEVIIIAKKGLKAMADVHKGSATRDRQTTRSLKRRAQFPKP